MPVLEQVLERHPNEVKLVFKNFPLRRHKFALMATLAAFAAERQSKFWEFHDLLFKNLRQLNEKKLQQICEQINLDMEKFEKDRKDPEVMAIVNRDLREASEAGVRGTPTVFVNGKLLRNRTLEGFETIIVKELKKTSTHQGK